MPYLRAILPLDDVYDNNIYGLADAYGLPSIYTFRAQSSSLDSNGFSISTTTSTHQLLYQQLEH
jgi:hypothetical protein